MFARKGFVSLAGLWQDFQRGYLPLCKECALDVMKADPHSSDFVFGTALDLCEDAFLRTFDPFQLSLVPHHGEALQVAAVIANSGASLLQKTTAFESSHICMLPDEAGQDGKWLKQIGSTAFEPANLRWISPDARGRCGGTDLEDALFANVFHTLPVLFERSAFTIANERPPWSRDLLEDSYARNVWQQTRGYSICLDEVSGRKWKKELSRRSVAGILSALHPKFLAFSPAESAKPNGRPRKIDKALDAYIKLNLTSQELSLKEEQNLLESHLNFTVSITLLARVRSDLRSK